MRIIKAFYHRKDEMTETNIGGLEGRLFYAEPHTKIYQGHALDVLKDLPSEYVDCVITSPP